MPARFLCTALVALVAAGCLDLKAPSSPPQAAATKPSASRPKTQATPIARPIGASPIVAPVVVDSVRATRTAEFIGQVVGVSDGDTITVLDSTKTQHKVRLEGIDAPESHQAWGERCKQELSRRVFLKQVRVLETGTDKYGRTLGHVYVGDLWVNRDLILAGFAWHYKEYNSEATLADAEVRARASKAGLWSSQNPVAPWLFRHDAGAAASAMASPAPAGGGTFVYVTASGTKYHQANCRYLAKGARALELNEARQRYAPCSVCNTGVAATSESRAVPTRAAPLAAFDGTSNVTVYVTKTGSKYHSAGCRYLSKSAIPMSLSDARRRYGACSVCDPP